ncbi:MAG: hypothetical protein ABIP90_11590 [Vicinamibacterales bacterium]
MSTIPRYRVGRDLMPINLTAEDAWLEGRHRLRPGRVIELADVPSSHGPEQRHAMVESWAVASVGSNGPLYRGRCRWVEPSG